MSKGTCTKAIIAQQIGDGVIPFTYWAFKLILNAFSLTTSNCPSLKATWNRDFPYILYRCWKVNRYFKLIKKYQFGWTTSYSSLTQHDADVSFRTLVEGGKHKFHKTTSFLELLRQYCWISIPHFRRCRRMLPAKVTRLLASQSCYITVRGAAPFCLRNDSSQTHPWTWVNVINFLITQKFIKA